MSTIQNILFPVDFSPSCVAMAPYVKTAATILGARVTLVYVFDLYSRDAVQLYVRPLSEVAEEQQGLARDKLNSFLKSEFPLEEYPRILLSGDGARQIVDRKSTRLNSSHGYISYAVFCLKKKNHDSIHALKLSCTTMTSPRLRGSSSGPKPTVSITANISRRKITCQTRTLSPVRSHYSL